MEQKNHPAIAVSEKNIVNKIYVIREPTYPSFERRGNEGGCNLSSATR